jgi:hypothetical protein
MDRRDNFNVVSKYEICNLCRNNVFGLVVISNQNLRTLAWDKRKDLSLGSNTDLKILVLQNPWLCMEDLKQLENTFRWTVVQWSNGYRGMCKLVEAM